MSIQHSLLIAKKLGYPSFIEKFFQIKWILFVTFILLTLFLNTLPSFYLVSKQEKIRTSVVCKKTVKNGQEILGRIECPLEGYDSVSIIMNNSKPFPHRSWSYNRRNGICAGKDAKNCVPGFKQQSQTLHYAIANPTKTVHCMVQKSMSRVFETLAWFLNDPLEFFLSQKDLIEDVFERYLYKGDVWKKSKKWQHVMIVRDPIERFVSGYIHLCLAGKRGSCRRYCNECGTDIACFIERQFKETQEFAERKKINMRNGVHYVTQKMKHMAPQTWYCDLNKHLHKYKFLYYNSNSTIFFDQQLGPFLKSRNVTNSTLNYIRTRMTTTRAAHSTNGFEAKSYLEEKIRSTPYLLEMMVRMFYHDYIAFNIPFPTVNK